MPVDIVSTGGSPFQIIANEEVVELASQPKTIHTAIEAGLNHAEKCKCEVKVTQNMELRIVWTPSEPVIDNGSECTTEHFISWNAPTARTDGESLTLGEISHYVLTQYLELDGETLFQRTVDPVEGLEYTISIPGISYRYDLRTVDTDGLTSQSSEKITVQ